MTRAVEHVSKRNAKSSAVSDRARWSQDAAVSAGLRASDMARRHARGRAKAADAREVAAMPRQSARRAGVGSAIRRHARDAQHVGGGSK